MENEGQGNVVLDYSFIIVKKGGIMEVVQIYGWFCSINRYKGRRVK